MGAIKALRGSGRRVSEDVSVIGWDDIHGAAFHNPSLTTVRQPLRQMGVVAAEILLKRITALTGAAYSKEIVREPELVVRGSTAQRKWSINCGRTRSQIELIADRVCNPPLTPR